jgi:hypothetical protein
MGKGVQQIMEYFVQSYAMSIGLLPAFRTELLKGDQFFVAIGAVFGLH